MASHRRFADLVAALPEDAVIAVDMPIGLPDRVSRGGRGPEQAIRPLLGERRSSVFSIPSRDAVHAEPGPFASLAAAYDAHTRACEIARQTSDPPRGISIQAFFLFDKIREIDGLLRADMALSERVIESHPEFAFCQLNGGRPVALAKKVKGRVNPDGMTARRALLSGAGFGQDFLQTSLPSGCGTDDFLDACAMVTVAARHAAGIARPNPSPLVRDRHGIPVAIWW
jgi:predicted RNase H-like nuclease